MYIAAIGSAGFKHFAYALSVTPAVLPGDYNGDGTVDAADYVVWRKHDGTAAELPNDETPGMVDDSDYTVWTTNFGATRPTGSGSNQTATAATPEPTSIALLCAAFVSLGLIAGRKRGPNMVSG